MKLASTLLFSCLLAFTVSTSSAVVIEDFEDGDISDWTITTTNVYAAVTAAAAHDGNYGLEMEGGYTNDWMYRDDGAVLVEQGYVISFWTKTHSGSGRNYCAFGATAAGTYSASLGMNTSTFIIHLIPGLSSYTTLADVPQTYTTNTWYRVEVHWDVGGLITAYLYASDLPAARAAYDMHAVNAISHVAHRATPVGADGVAQNVVVIASGVDDDHPTPAACHDDVAQARVHDVADLVVLGSGVDGDAMVAVGEGGCHVRIGADKKCQNQRSYERSVSFHFCLLRVQNCVSIPG